MVEHADAAASGGGSVVGDLGGGLVSTIALSDPPRIGQADPSVRVGAQGQFGRAMLSGADRPSGSTRLSGLVQGVRGGEGAPGSYRTVQNFVANSETRAVIYTPPPPGDVPSLMQELVA